MAIIRNPIEWGADQLGHGAHHLASVSRALHGTEAPTRRPEVQRVEVADLKDALARGLDDFAACRSDVVFLCLVYPLAGLVLAQLTFHQEFLHLLFPLVSGFALLGPLAAVGLYEMSRQREQGVEATWSHAFGMVRSPSFGAILVLGLMLLAIFLLWMVAALLVYLATLGPQPPASLPALARDALTTGAGWAMIVAGIGIGFLFAVLVLAISVVSFPLLLDREVGLGRAIATSVRVVRTNPGTMALWGLVVVLGLVIGSIPLLLGLIVVMPVLGHATWHLYRKAVAC